MTRRSFLKGGIWSFLVLAACGVAHKTVRPPKREDDSVARGVSGENPSVAGEGIEIEAAPTMSLGEPAGGVIHVTLQLPRELVESLGMHPLKGAMLCAVEARSQTPYCCNISKAKRVDTVEPVKKGRSCRFSLDVDLMKALQLPQWGGVYFLHASCMQYRSRVVAVRVGEESEKVRK